MKQLITLITCILLFSNLSANSSKDSLLLEGKELFKLNCRACHNIDKKLVGPALSKVYERRDSTWIYNFIKASQQMISDGDPIANDLYRQYNKVIMPNQELSNHEITLVLNYIKNSDSKLETASTNSITRPSTPILQYSNHFRFSNYLFWIPFTLSVILGVIVLYYLTHHYDLVQEHYKNSQQH